MLEATIAQDQRLDEASASMQVVGFRLAQEEYGIEITRVQEIVLMGEIIRVPQTSPFIKGLINLRCAVIPIVDLRILLGLSEQDATDETRNMVVNVRGKTLGIIMDAVSEVLPVSNDQMDLPPPSVAGLRMEFLTGLMGLGSHLLILLEIGKLLSAEDHTAVNTNSSPAS